MRDVIHTPRRRFLQALPPLAIAIALVAPVRAQEPKRVNPDAKAIAGFLQAVGDYVALHDKLEKSLPALPRDATPEAIDRHERTLERLIQQARRGAKPGDVFHSDVRPVIRRLVQGTLAGPDGKKLRASLHDENPGPAVKPVINGRYPDTIPLSSVPPQILQALPRLPDELEYRFIDDKLLLLDKHAHIIVDYLIGAVPR